MDRAPQHRALLERALVSTVALLCVVIVSSAFLRLAQDGLGCADWPACYGVIASQAPGGGEVPALQMVMRIVHRIAASGVGFAVIVIAVLCYRRGSDSGRKWLAGVLLVLTVFLAVLGRATPGAVLPAVTLGNLLGGLLMLGLLWHLRLRVAGGALSRASGWVSLGIALLALQIVLGASVSAFHAAASCATLPGCNDVWLPSGGSLASLDPLHPPPALSGAALAEDPSRAALHMAHRYTALLLLAYWVGLALALARVGHGARGAAALAAGVLLAQGVVGATAVWFAMPLALAVLHNAFAGLAVLAAVTTFSQSRAADAAPVSAACQMVISK